MISNYSSDFWRTNCPIHYLTANGTANWHYVNERNLVPSFWKRMGRGMHILTKELDCQRKERDFCKKTNHVILDWVIPKHYICQLSWRAPTENMSISPQKYIHSNLTSHWREEKLKRSNFFITSSNRYNSQN